MNSIPASLIHGLTLCLVTLGMIASPVTLCADTLHEVKQSSAMHSVISDTRKERSANKGDSYLPRGMDEDSNFASIWLSEKSPKVLLSWISATIPTYSTGTPIIRRKKEFAEARVTISNSIRSAVTLTIRVPHPTYRTMVEHRTLPDFTGFEPPRLPSIYQEKVPLNGVEGMMYQTARNECSIVVQAAQLAVVNLAVTDCKERQLLVDVAKALDFLRLNRKLTS
jgi:hypothetical protein